MISIISLSLWVFSTLSTSQSSSVLIDAFRIKVSDKDYAGTSGKLKFEVSQGWTSCETVRDTFTSPQRNQYYTKTRYSDSSRFGSCSSARFNTRDALQFRVLSDSGDDCYLNSAGVKIGDIWVDWNGYNVKFNKHGEGDSWRDAPISMLILYSSINVSGLT